MAGTTLDAESEAEAKRGRRRQAPADETAQRRSARRSRPLWQLAVLIGVLAFVVRVWAPGPVTQTTDEFAWFLSSDAFRRAVVDGKLGEASNSSVAVPEYTQPGVTTMWAGALGYGAVAAGERLGVIAEEPGYARADRARVLRASRSVVSLWCAITLAALIVIAARLVGRRAAMVAGVLLAAEPFLVGHSHVLHTDAMVTMFGALAVVALAAACRDRTSAVDRRLLVVAGVAAGLTALTKLNGVPLVLGGAAVVLVVRTDWRRASVAASLRRTVLIGLAFTGLAVAAFFLVWPALWVDPWSELERLPRSLHQLGHENFTYFRSKVMADPGVRYYPYALALRLSPWLVIATAASVVATVVHLVRRRHATDRSTTWPTPSVLAVLLLAPAPYAVLISFTGQKYDRYALPVVPYLALLAGVGIVVAAERWSARFGDRLLRPAGLAAVVGMFAVTAAIQPYALAFADPLVGGQKRARDHIQLGWGEGYEVLGAEIDRRERGACDDVQIYSVNDFADYIAMPCGEIRSDFDVGPGDYVIRYISEIQQMPDDPVRLDVMRRGELVKEVDIYGVTYAELWQFPG
jgi:hypothetical protein